MKENSKLWSCVHELTGIQKSVNSKYILSYSNWNDFGYQTGFHLFLPLEKPKDGVYNIGVSWLSVVEHYPVLRSPGRFFPIEGECKFHVIHNICRRCGTFLPFVDL